MSSRSQGSPEEGSRSDTPEIDYSVIRTAIKIGGKVIDQVLNGIHYGSEEVRNLLLEECDIILECKVCRNMFRGLPNLVAHKRVYCTETYKEQKRKESEQSSVESEETLVVQPDSPNETAVDNIASSSQSKTSKSLVDKVVNRTFEGQSKSYNFYTKIAEKMEAKRIQKPTCTVTLKNIPSNPNAKVMTLAEKGLSDEATLNQQPAATDNESSKAVRDEMDVEDSAGNVVGTKTRPKPSISQLCDKLANSSAVAVSTSELQTSPSKPAYARPVRLRNRKSSPRKSVDSFIGMKGQETERSNKTPGPTAGHKESTVVNNDTVDDDTDFSADMRQFVPDFALDKSWLVHCDLKTLTCRTCDKRFTTPYGLKFHCKMKHVDKLVQYPCPQCKKKFTYFTALARHLRAVHTKSERDIEFIQSKLKGKFGRRNSLESEIEANASDTEKSPEQLKKNMLALDTGWKKCDKCGKICWKAKSYYRHYQYCKGSNDSSKSSSVETSPVKNRDKGPVKKVNEKIKAVLNLKEEGLKEKHKFNEKLTIRTRKQAESMNQNVNQNIESPLEDASNTAEKLVKSPGITITITEPHEIKDNQKVRALNFDEDKQSSKEISPIDIEKLRNDKKNVEKEHDPIKIHSGKLISPKANTEKIDQINVNLVGKRIMSTEKAVVAQKNSSNDRSEAGRVKDSETKALQDALLSFNSSLDTNKDKQEIDRQHRGNDKQIQPPAKQSIHDESRAAGKEYVKPVTRKADQSVKESRRESSDSQVRSLTISKILMKPVGRQSENEPRLNKEHIKPATRGADSAHYTNIKAVKNTNDNEQSLHVQSKLHDKIMTNVANTVETLQETSTTSYSNTTCKTVKIQSPNKTDSKQVDKGLENNQSVNKEYTKPVTRRDDRTLPLQKDRKDVSNDSQIAQSPTASKPVTKPVESRSVSKGLERQKEIQDMQNMDYVKPVTRGADGSLKDTARKDIHGKDNKVNPEIQHPVSMEAYAKLKEKQAEFEQNACKNNFLQSDIDMTDRNKNKQINDDNVKGTEDRAIAVLGHLQPISVKIPGSPSNKDTDSVRSSLDSPTWTDNPMSKFKMTVKEMAELVESASLTKFARERKKKAKQILNKKQNESAKTVKKKFKKKKPVPVVKKIYGTRLSTGTKSETVGSSSFETENKGHRYATRNMDVKTSGAENEYDKGHKYETNNMDVKASGPENEHKFRYETRTTNVKIANETTHVHETKNVNEISKKPGAKSIKVGTATKNIPKDEVTATPGIEDHEIAADHKIAIKVEEHATLNSKRKEFLAAKRDQRRKFLLANKTASPKKPSPEKVQPSRARVLKDLPVSPKKSNNAAIKSLFPKNEKSLSKNEKTMKTEDSDVETVEGPKLRLRSHEPKIPDAKKASESVVEHTISKGAEKQELAETSKIGTDSDASVSKIRSSRLSTSPGQTKLHELRSKSESLDRGSRAFGQISKPLERKRSSLPEPTSHNSQRKLLIQRHMKEGIINVKSGRSRSSENIPISKLTLSRKTKEDWSPVKTDRELRHPRSESIQLSTQVTQMSEIQNERPKSNNTSINKAEIKSVEKEMEKESSDSIAKGTKDIDSNPHKTRLSTGSLPLTIRTTKPAESEMSTTQSSSTEDSSRELAPKSKKKRKRHLSAPQNKVETVPKEVKRFSLSTGVIQCEGCGKAFWKKTSHTVHMLKSPCGKKQRATKTMVNTSVKTMDQSDGDKVNDKAINTKAKTSAKTMDIQNQSDKDKVNDNALKTTAKTSAKTMDVQNQSDKDKVNDKALKITANTSTKTMDVQNQSDQDKVDDKAMKRSDASMKKSQVVADQIESSPSSTEHIGENQSFVENTKDSAHSEMKINDKSSKSERSESDGVKLRTKRPLSVSPKAVTKSLHMDESTITVEASKRPRLEMGENSNVESNLPSLATDSKTEEQIEKGKLIGEEISKNINADVAAISEKQDNTSINSTSNGMEFAITKISDEIPGTSKDYVDNDSDTGSEFSGFSEADLSYPTLPDDISDYDSDSSTCKTATTRFETENLDNDHEDNEMEMTVVKDFEDNEERSVMSVEEVWVGKEPGMPVTEKLKSNRIYVMDTESSRRLHCQDKRNIDSFVDESSMKCLRCDKKYSNISNLRQHVIRHLGWKRYQCRTCTAFSCYNLSEARMHLSRSHGLKVKADSDLPKYIKDLNKEAGKKRSTKRMKTIKKKKSFESSIGKKASSSKAELRVTHESDLNASNDTTITNITADNVGQGNSSQNKSENSANNESGSILKEHEYSKEPLHNKVRDSMSEGTEHTVIESNGVLHVEEVHGNVSPVKKSVRLAAKEDTRKSAVEVLKGPKLPPSPRKAVVSPKSGGQKVNKPATKSTDSGNTEDESPLIKARQMLAHVLNP